MRPATSATNAASAPPAAARSLHWRIAPVDQFRTQLGHAFMTCEGHRPADSSIERGYDVLDASLTARATTEAVRRVLALHQVLSSQTPAGAKP